MLTDLIAKMIEEMLDEQNGSLELQRNEMATRLGCVPSQISYVISSRFTPERGYVIESHKGGGGCIRIVRKEMSRSEYLMHFFCAVGETIDESEAKAYLKNLYGYGYLDKQGLAVSSAAVSTQALASAPFAIRNKIRADLLKQILLSLMNHQ
ncbi:MAG: CtsR family transcriptional regulator [Clostridia bacterium]|nr:CtsR family transcriptional regulator [Clostridia bacterium]